MAYRMLTAEELERLHAARPAEAEPPGTDDAPLLHLLASIDRDRLADMMVEQHYQPGEIVAMEGESGDAMYIIWSGYVAVVKGNFQSPTVIGYRGPGETVGELALLDNQPRSATMVAMENLRLLRIGRDNFHEWLATNPAIGMTIMATLSARLRAASAVVYADDHAERQLVRQVSRLQTEKEQLLELQRVRQETSDLIVHDLRNPLGIIYGALNMFEMVLPEGVLEENRELLDLATSACMRMQRLVDSLLDVARLETGEVQVNLQSVDIRPLLMEAIRREALAFQKRAVTATPAVPDDLPAVMIDPEKIDRVLANLVDNALKFTPTGGEIVIAAHVAGNTLVASVTDNGPGIPPDQKQRVFERFAQVEGERRRGFGLGLTFCRVAIEAHGGEIWVEDGPGGVGSRFVFTLPL